MTYDPRVSLRPVAVSVFLGLHRELLPAAGPASVLRPLLRSVLQGGVPTPSPAGSVGPGLRWASWTRARGLLFPEDTHPSRDLRRSSCVRRPLLRGWSGVDAVSFHVHVPACPLSVHTPDAEYACVLACQLPSVSAACSLFGAVGREEAWGGIHSRTPESTRGPFVLPCVPPSGSGLRLGASLSTRPITSCAVLMAAGLTEGPSGLCLRPAVSRAGSWVPGHEGSLGCRARAWAEQAPGCCSEGVSPLEPRTLPGNEIAPRLQRV